MIVGAVAGLALLGAGGWFAYNTFFNVIPLTTYEGKGYSILVPKDYTKKNNFSDSDISFEEPNADSEERSEESISVLSDIKDGRDELIKQVDANLTEDKVKDSFTEEDTKLENYKVEKTTYDGHDARKITATATKDGKKVGSIHMMMVFGDNDFYYVTLLAHVSDPSFEHASGKILSSLKLK